MTDKQREAFELSNPRPENVVWMPERNEYVEIRDGAWCGCRYHDRWLGWKSCAQPPEQGESVFDAWVLYDPETNAMRMDPYTGSLAIFEEESHAEAAKASHPGTEYKHIAWNKRPQPPKAVPDGWTPQHTEFLRAVCLNPGGKLNGGEAGHWFDDGTEYGSSVALWKLAEDAGLVKTMGSYKWIPTSRVSLCVCVDGVPISDQISPKDHPGPSTTDVDD